MDVDVFIAGGGLAGLTLARQLRQEAPHLRITVVEKRRHPAREAAFKVGESTVEIGAHYLQVVLGLEPHLREAHLEKLGIRYFFPYGDNRTLMPRFEVGPPTFPVTPSFQIDRGRLENMLLAANREMGIDVEDGARVEQFTLGRPAHQIVLSTSRGRQRVDARWFVDASGRAGLIRRRLGLTREVTHRASACWFRIGERLRVDDWATDAAWKARVASGKRWLSTNHLMGQGYWVWLIPLGSGSTSVGIVADSALHPWSRLSRFECALDWLREFEPQCGEAVASHRDDVEDFLALRHYAYGCSRVYSPERWALTGEAGLFTDPFYSPGSDFIAIGNDCITDLIVREQRGEDIAPRVEQFNTNYLRLFEAFLRLYDGQYRLMGNAQVMTAKAAWDNATYWAITALLYFQRRFRCPEFLASIDSLMKRFFVLHARMQTFLNQWDRVDTSTYAHGSTNVVLVDFLRVLQGELTAPKMDDEALRLKLHANLAMLERLAKSLHGAASERHPELARHAPPTSPDTAPLDIGPLLLRPVIGH